MIIAWETTPRLPTPASSSHWDALGGVHRTAAGTTVRASDIRQKYASMVAWLSPSGSRFTMQTATAMPNTEASATRAAGRSEEHTSELQSLMRISYAVFCLQKKIKNTQDTHTLPTNNNS